MRGGNSTLCYIVRDNRDIGCLLDREGYFLCGWRGVIGFPLEMSRTMSCLLNRTSDGPYRTAWIDIDKKSRKGRFSPKLISINHRDPRQEKRMKNEEQQIIERSESSIRVWAGAEIQKR